MRARSLGLVTMAALMAASCTAVAAAAGAAPGPGTFTAITTPSGASKTIRFHPPPSTTTLTVSGQASSDVTTIDIDCVFEPVGGPEVTTLATSVPVAGNAFSTVAIIPQLLANCRLRAVPTGVDPAVDYLGAYSGPILYSWGLVPETDGSTTVGYQAGAGRADGIAIAADAMSCGPALMATIAPPTMAVLGLGREAWTVALPSGNLTATGTSTASSIKVSGHNAYLPGSVSNYLRGNLALTLTQPVLTTTLSRADNGDLAITESGTLWRCSAADLYPPTSVSCPSLVDTGVSFQRLTSLVRGSHQVLVEDTFTSTDSKSHSVSLQYQSQAQPTDAGAPGFLFPTGGHFVTASSNQVLTGLGTKAATVLIRSDIHAFEGEQSADTRALTWSRAPSKIQFSADSPTRRFATPYALNVPAHAKASLGFALSDANRTSQVRALAALATNEVLKAPTITSPANHAHLHGHSITVRGGVTRGANGFPTAVSVNGHAATLTRVSATRASYQVTFSMPFGSHTITATATHLGRNQRTTSITVANSA